MMYNGLINALICVQFRLNHCYNENTKVDPDSTLMPHKYLFSFFFMLEITQIVSACAKIAQAFLLRLNHVY